MLKSSFLATLKSNHPKLFWIIIVFLGINLFFTLIQIEAPPFYVYSMYSTPMEIPATQTVYTIECDGVVFNEPEIWNHHRRIQFNYSIAYYDQSLQADSSAADGIKAVVKLEKMMGENKSYYEKVYTQTSDIVLYPRWLKKYMESLLGKQISQMQVFKIIVQYQSDGSVKELSKMMLCES